MIIEDQTGEDTRDTTYDQSMFAIQKDNYDEDDQGDQEEEIIEDDKGDQIENTRLAPTFPQCLNKFV